MCRAFNRSASFSIPFELIWRRLSCRVLRGGGEESGLGFGGGGCVLQIDDFILVSSVLSNEYSLSILPSCLFFVSSLGLVSVLLNFVDDFWLGRFFDSLFVV